MKLTDIMFNLDYIAANTGAVKDTGSSIFKYDTVENYSTPISLDVATIVSGGTAYIWYKEAGSTGDMIRLAPNDDGKYAFPTTGKDYCIMYRKNESAAEVITINSQFIPQVLHAVLTVALYSGDNCNVESATKAGEVVIDIPRLQLSGAMDISMTATGAAQTPLEGNALASGCTSCDGKAVYATITKYISNANWYDDAQGIVIEDLSGMTAGQEKEVVVYAYYANKAPKKLANSEWTLAKVSGDGTVDNTNKKVTAAAGTTVISATAVGNTALETNKAVIVSA